MDASSGLLLKGERKGNFIPQPSGVSGLFLYGDMKSLAGMQDKAGHEMIVAAGNTDSLKVFSPSLNTTTKIFCGNLPDAYAEITYMDGRKTGVFITVQAICLNQRGLLQLTA